MSGIHRRNLLMGAGALSLIGALPRTLGLGSSHRYPTRIVFFYTPNGTVLDSFRPTGTETNFQLSEILAPLQPFKDKMLVLGELDNLAARTGGGGPHAWGLGSMLTGWQVPGGHFFGAGYAAGLSLDQHIANLVGNGTPFRSLELGVQPSATGPRQRLSYAAPGNPMPPFESPWEAYGALFGPTQGPDPDARLSLLRQSRSEIDVIARDYSGDDAARLAYHQSSIDEVDRRLRHAPPSIVFPPPQLGPAVDLQALDNYPVIGQKHMDVLVAALANDMTRVASLQWSWASGEPSFQKLFGFPEDHHALSHKPDNDLESRAKLVKINVWQAQQLAYLANQMSQVKEGDETLLDHTVIFWCSELSTGNVHSHEDMPYVLLGGANGKLKTGRWLKFGGASHTDLLVTLANVMGSPISVFGDPKYGHGGLGDALLV